MLGLTVPVGVMVGAALVRFATLGMQSYEADEAVTVHLLHMPLGAMLSAIPGSESTPPLYYVLAWLWARIFGFGEVGVRSLSAAFGTLTVAAVFVIADRFVSRRAAIAASLLAAVNPFMFWFSQEARSYALLALLSAISIGLFLELLTRPVRARVALAWAACCAAALATHYFAAFPVGLEAVWLVIARRGDRRILAAVALVIAAGVALAPLAIHQKGHAAYAPLLAAGGSLATRTAQIPKQFLIGYNGPLEVALGALGILLAAAILIWWWIRSPGRRWEAAPFALIGAGSVLIPVLLALVGLDFLIARNVIEAWVPLAILIALAATAPGARRLGLVLFGGLVVLCAGVLIADLINPAYQRDDWRDAARALGAEPYARALVLTGPASVQPVAGSPPPAPLALYLPTVRAPRPGGTPVREVDYVALLIRQTLGSRRLPRSLAGRVPASWRQVARVSGPTYTVVRYRLPRPLRVGPEVTRGLGGLPSQVLIVGPASRAR